MFKAFECDQPADADDSWDRRNVWGRNRRRESFQIDPIINTMNFRRGIRAALAEKVATVIGLRGYELRGRANFAKQIVAAEILHKILAMRGDAEWDPGNLFQKKRCVRCAIGEMNMHMVDLLPREEVCEVKSIVRALLGLHAGAVFPLVSLNEIAWRCTSNVRVVLQDS